MIDLVARCPTCGMQRGEHDRACVNEQLHRQKLEIVKKLVEERKNHADNSFPSRMVKSTLERAIKIVQET